MAITKPYFKLYESDGVTLAYTFPLVQSTNAPQSAKKTVILESPRGKGAIIVDGGEDTWELIINGLHAIDSDETYEDLVVAMDEMENSIELNTEYVLRIDKTATTYYEYNVKRITSIEYSESLRISTQPYLVRFIVNSW